MMIRIWTLCLALNFVATGFAAAQTLTKVTVTFHTTNDDKDHDTKLFMHIRDGKREIAGGEIACGMRFPDWKTNGPFELPNVDRNVQRFALKDFQTHIRIEPVGNDTWRFHYTATFHWSIGPPTVVENRGPGKNGHELNQNKRSHTWHMRAP